MMLQLLKNDFKTYSFAAFESSNFVTMER